MVLGTSSRFSLRRSAVTTTSASSPPVAVAAAVSAGAANTIAVLGAHSIAATAAEIFGLGFIAFDPQGLVVYSPLERIPPAQAAPQRSSIPRAANTLE